MLQVKFIRCTTAAIEGQINTFLHEIGSEKGKSVSVLDIKFNHIGGQQDLSEALIIYNSVKVKIPDAAPPRQNVK